MFCSQWGAYNPDQASFCGACGRRFEKEDVVPQPPVNVVEYPTTPVPPVQPTPPPVAPDSPTVWSTSYSAEAAPPYNFFASGESWSAPPAERITPLAPGIPAVGPSSPLNPPASEAFYASGAHAAPTESYPMPGGGYMEAPTAPPPPLPPPARPSLFKQLARPLPLWAFIGAIVLVAGLLVVLQLTGSDWAAGA